MESVITSFGSETISLRIEINQTRTIRFKRTAWSSENANAEDDQEEENARKQFSHIDMLKMYMLI